MRIDFFLLIFENFASMKYSIPRYVIVDLEKGLRAKIR
jgi:hypothetical protein